MDRLFAAANVSVALVDIGPERTTLISEGWRDPQNRRSLRRTQWVEPDRAYTLRVSCRRSTAHGSAAIGSGWSCCPVTTTTPCGRQPARG